MQNKPVISLEDMMAEAELFQSVYPALIGEIDRVENTRGKLNDFQLMLAVAHAKDGLGVLSFERRQTINAILNTFTNIYRKNGRTSAVKWAKETFGCTSETVNSEDTTNIELMIDELSRLIREKETELLQIYREFYMLQSYIAKDEGDNSTP